jgi:small subunit ribosomal protein S5
MAEKTEKKSKEEVPKEEKKTEKKEEIKKEEKKPEEKPKEETPVEEVKVPAVGTKVEAPKIEEKIPKVTEKIEEELSKWTFRTNLGKSVMKREITDINKILDAGVKIKEAEIVDMLVPNLETEFVLVGGRPGKGGGIERTPLRISAKMHGSGRRFTSTAFAIVGNKDGLIGIGKGRGKDSRNAIAKAVKKAKLNIIKVKRGCGSWECECGESHSIPYKTSGKSGSVTVFLMPAPKGIGLAVDDESKKLLRLAGINDVWGKTLGDTATRFNLITAAFNALKNLHRYKTGE